MSQNIQIILIKSTSNTDLIESVFRFNQNNENILFLSNRKSSLLSYSFKKLQTKMSTFDSTYSRTSCMFLKNSSNIQKPILGKNSFLDDVEKMISDSRYDCIYFHRLDTMLNCTLHYDCSYLISKIKEMAYTYGKKVIFSMNNKTMQGHILEPILLRNVNQQYTIVDQSSEDFQQLMLLKSVDNSYLVKTALSFHQNNKGVLFISGAKQQVFSEIFKDLQKSMKGFDDLYLNLSCMFLKNSWSFLDRVYGHNIFLVELQEIMSSDEFSTIYLHRIDEFMLGASQIEYENMMMGVKELANYFHKKVIFSIDSNTQSGQILEPILVDIVDFMQEDGKLIYKPANIISNNKTQKREIV